MMLLFMCNFSILCHYINVITPKSRSDYDKMKMWANPSLLGTQHQKEGFGCEAPRQSNIVSSGCISTSICLKQQNRRLAAALWAVLKLGLTYLHSDFILCLPTYILVLIIFHFLSSVKLKHWINTLHLRDTEYSPLNYFQCIPLDLLLKTKHFKDASDIQLVWSDLISLSSLIPRQLHSMTLT